MLVAEGHGPQTKYRVTGIAHVSDVSRQLVGDITDAKGVALPSATLSTASIACSPPYSAEPGTILTRAL